ncbi:MAG TPA: hypothetical protein VMZ66_00025 [Aeromicrobium sp.]|nr:hypothetical protein [Aeromicrobium sp.]
MNDHAWLLHIFKVSNRSTQQLAAAMIGSSPTLTAHTATSGSDHYVFVDAPDEEQAHLAYELLMRADSDSVLLHTARGPAEPVASRVAQVIPLPARHQEDLVG